MNETDARWYSFSVVPAKGVSEGYEGELWIVDPIVKEGDVLIDPVTPITTQDWYAETKEGVIERFYRDGLLKLLRRGHHVIIAGFDDSE